MAAKLLIVDDEPFTVDMLETFLQINGFETVGAFNGEDGLVLVKVEQPQLVILDLMLPDIEGYEVCQRIRQYPQSSDLPVLVLSARAEATSKERAMQAGADGYLVKPVQFPLLLSELTRLLNKPRIVPSTDTAVPPPVTQDANSLPTITTDIPMIDTPAKSDMPHISPVPLVTPPDPTASINNQNGTTHSPTPDKPADDQK